MSRRRQEPKRSSQKNSGAQTTVTLEALVVKRRPPAISINEMVEVAKLPWGEQMGRVF